MEFAGCQPFFCALFDAVMASSAHMGMDWSVSEALGLECVIHQFFDGVTNYAFHTHAESLLFYPDGCYIGDRFVQIASIRQQDVDRSVVAERLAFLAEFQDQIF